MKVDYLVKSLAVCVLLALSSPSIAGEGTANPTSEITPENRANSLQNRLEEIKSIDKRMLSSAEKKELRREVRAIKKELAAISGGVYLSVGAIILIALLLILLL